MTAVLLGAGCRSYGSRIRQFRSLYESGNFAGANAHIDLMIARESGEPLEVVRETQALDDSIDPAEGNTDLLLLEKAMAVLALGQPETTLRLLEKAKDRFDDKFVRSVGAKFWSEFTATLTDDSSLPYRGADYEHIVIRCVLAIADLLVDGREAYTYALQIGEKQEDIIGSDYGFEQDLDSEGTDRGRYKPRERYSRVAIGKYLEGIILEANIQADEAQRSYAAAIDFHGPSTLLTEALERARSGIKAPPGEGVVHVFYLAGRGPELIEDPADPGTEIASRIAGVGLGIGMRSWSAAMQAPVLVPRVVVLDSFVPPLEIGLPNGERVVTETLLDVNATAIEQNNANMPVTIARAVVRRSLKAAAVGTGERILRKQMGNTYEAHNLAFLIGMIVNLFWTAVETADTRMWTSLPSQIQVARFSLPEGVHRLQLGRDLEASVVARPGQDAVVVVIRPHLNARGRVLVNRASRVEEPVVAPQVN